MNMLLISAKKLGTPCAYKGRRVINKCYWILHYLDANAPLIRSRHIALYKFNTGSVVNARIGSENLI